MGRINLEESWLNLLAVLLTCCSYYNCNFYPLYDTLPGDAGSSSGQPLFASGAHRSHSMQRASVIPQRLLSQPDSCGQDDRLGYVQSHCHTDISPVHPVLGTGTFCIFLGEFRPNDYFTWTPFLYQGETPFKNTRPTLPKYCCWPVSCGVHLQSCLSPSHFFQKRLLCCHPFELHSQGLSGPAQGLVVAST